MKFLSVLSLNTYYQVLIFLRLKQAVFFTFFFPIFLYVVFNSLWGDSAADYSFYLLTGVIAMLVASDSFFAISPVIKQFYSTGFIKYVKKMPIHVIVHFMSLIFSRLLVITLEIICLLLLGVLFFQVEIDMINVLNIFLGSSIGLFVFAFMGLSLNFADIKSNGSGKNIVNIIYFSMLFTSDTFYPTKMLKPSIGYVADWLPLNHVLYIMRGDGDLNLVILMSWLLLSMIVFSWLFSKSTITR